MTVDYKIFDRDKFTIVGSPTITDDGVVSGFSESNYVTTDITSKIVNNLELEFEVDTNNISTRQVLVSGKADRTFLIDVQNRKITLSIGNGAAWIRQALTGTTTLLDNTKYKILVRLSNNTIYLYLDGNLELSADVSGLDFDISNIYMIGGRPFATFLPYLGSIMLKSFIVTSDNIIVFSGYRNGTLVEKLIYLNDTKELIRQAIISKGVDVPVGTPFREYADKINLIVVAPQEGIRTKDGVLYIPKGTVFNIENFETQETTQYILPEEISIPDASYGSVTMSDGQAIRYSSTVSSYQTTWQSTGVRFRQSEYYIQEESFSITESAITLANAKYHSNQTGSYLRRLFLLNFIFTTNKGMGINKFNAGFRGMNISSVNGVYVHDWGTSKPSEFSYSNWEDQTVATSSKISDDDPSMNYTLIYSKSGINMYDIDCNFQEGHYYTIYAILTCGTPSAMQISDFRLGYKEMVYYYDQDLYIRTSGYEYGEQKNVSIQISPYSGSEIGTVKYNPETNWYDGKPIDT